MKQNNFGNVSKLNEMVNKWSDVIYSYFKSNTSDEVYLIKTKNYFGESQKDKYLQTCYDNQKKKDAITISDRYYNYARSNVVGYKMSLGEFSNEFVKNKVNNFIFFSEPYNNCAHMIIKTWNKSQFTSYNGGIGSTMITVRFSSVFMDNLDNKDGQASLYLSVNDIIKHDKDGLPISKIPEYLICLDNSSMYVVDGVKLTSYLRAQKNVLNHVVCPLNKKSSYVKDIILYDSLGYHINGRTMNIISMPFSEDFKKSCIGSCKTSKGGRTRKVIIRITDENGSVYEDTFNSLVLAAEGLSRSIGKKVGRNYIAGHLNKDFDIITSNTKKTLKISIIEVSESVCSSSNNSGRAPAKYSNIYSLNKYIYKSCIFGRCTSMCAEQLKRAHYKNVKI